MPFLNNLGHEETIKINKRVMKKNMEKYDFPTKIIIANKNKREKQSQIKSKKKKKKQS